MTPDVAAERPSTSVLHVGPFPPPVDGGIAAYIDGMLTSPLAERFPVERFDVRVDDVYRRHRLLRFGLGGRWLGRFARVVRRSPAALVHLHTTGYFGFWERALFAELAARRGLPYVLHIHGGNFDQFLNALRPWPRRLAGRTLGHAAAVIVPAAGWQPLFAPWVAPERLYTVPNAIHVDAFDGGPRPAGSGPVRILFVGMLSARKGLDELCTALTRLVHEGVSGFQVDIVGGEEVLGDGARYRALYRQAGLDAHVTFHGLKTGDEKLEFYRQADIFVLPSRSESFGIVNLEAMASRLAVVSTRTGAIPEYIVSEEHGLLVDPGDAKALAHALRRLIDDPALRLRLGEAARLQVQRYDWRAVAVSLAQLYDAVLARSRADRVASPPTP